MKDLTRIFDYLNYTYFHNEVIAGIGWRSSKIGKTKVTLGSYNIEERFIRINSILQDPKVPEWFVQAIVHHEMVHAYQSKYTKHPELHGEAFIALEKRFILYERAQDFQLTKLPRILAEHRKKKFGE